MSAGYVKDLRGQDARGALFTYCLQGGVNDLKGLRGLRRMPIFPPPLGSGRENRESWLLIVFAFLPLFALYID